MLGITVGDYTRSVVLFMPEARAFAEVLVVVALVAMLVQREMLRDRLPRTWAAAGFSGLTASTVPLVVAWISITIERFQALLS